MIYLNNVFDFFKPSFLSEKGVACYCKRPVMGTRLSWVPVLDPLTIWVILANYLISLNLCVFLFKIEIAISPLRGVL